MLIDSSLRVSSWVGLLLLLLLLPCWVLVSTCASPATTTTTASTTTASISTTTTTSTATSTSLFLLLLPPLPLPTLHAFRLLCSLSNAFVVIHDLFFRHGVCMFCWCVSGEDIYAVSRLNSYIANMRMPWESAEKTGALLLHCVFIVANCA